MSARKKSAKKGSARKATSEKRASAKRSSERRGVRSDRKRSSRGKKRRSRKRESDATLQIAVTFNPKNGKFGPTKFSSRLSQDTIGDFMPDATSRLEALTQLQRLGFTITGVGKLTASVRASRSLFERVFGTKLTRMDAMPLSGSCVVDSFYYPADDAPWDPDNDIKDVIDDAYIQWPHIYMNSLFPLNVPSPIPPQVDYHHLRVPGDVVSLLNVAPVHRRGGTGKGVTVAMIDSGFALGHQYFQRMDYNTSVVLAPGASDRELDGSGHGTAECANLLAVAPSVNFIGIKLNNEQNSALGASVLEGFLEALTHNPDIISVSIGFDLVLPQTRQHREQLPNGLVALEAEIEAAIAGGTTVVFSAGNGHVAFPGMMPDVISAGGVFVDFDGSMQASDYASGFMSRIYSGRQVPDVSGLVGMASNNAAYIMLPVPAGSETDADDGDTTAADDGWAVISGTSASAPQLAGICALLKERNPDLTPSEIKSLLRRSALDVVDGTASALSNEGVAQRAGVGPDSATGMGLVDAFAAWSQV